MSTSSDSTMFAALRGGFTPHPWRGPDASSDAYSLFVARSSAMGRLAPGGTWGMNDAGQDTAGNVTWFQVSLVEQLPQRPLPAQAFLSCAGDVVARLGVLRLDAVQILLPLQVIDPTRGDAVMSLLQDAIWYADRDPRLTVRVRITVDTGTNPAIERAAHPVAEWMGQFAQDVFRCDPIPTAESPDPLPDLTAALWHGPARHRSAFHGTLAEWSPESVGWLAAFVGEACARNGIDTPVVMTMSRFTAD